MKLVWVFIAVFLVVVILDEIAAAQTKKSSKKKPSSKKGVAKKKTAQKKPVKKPVRKPTTKPAHAPSPPQVLYSPIPVGSSDGTSRNLPDEKIMSDDYPNVPEVYEPSDYPNGYPEGYPNLPDYGNGNTGNGNSGGTVNFPDNTNDYDYDSNKDDGEENFEESWEIADNPGKNNNGNGHNRPPNGGWHNKPGRPNRGYGNGRHNGGYGNNFNNGAGNGHGGGPNPGNFNRNRGRHNRYGSRYDYNRGRYGRYQNNHRRRYNGGRNHGNNYRWETTDDDDDYYRKAKTNGKGRQNQPQKQPVSAGIVRNKRSVNGINGDLSEGHFRPFRDFFKGVAEQTKANCLFIYVNVPRYSNNDGEEPEPEPEQQGRKKPKLFRSKVAPLPKNKRQRLAATPKVMGKVKKMSDHRKNKIENNDT